MAVSEAHKKASYKYNASRDSITIRPERSKGAAIRAAAVASGKSLQNYILDALDARMEQEGRPLTLEEGAGSLKNSMLMLFTSLPAPDRGGYVTSLTRCGVVRCGCIVAPQRVACQARCGVFGGLHKKHGAVL